MGCSNFFANILDFLRCQSCTSSPISHASKMLSYDADTAPRPTRNIHTKDRASTPEFIYSRSGKRRVEKPPSMSDRQVPMTWINYENGKHLPPPEKPSILWIQEEKFGRNHEWDELTDVEEGEEEE